ncbi:MAG: hypothetical protein H6538_03320 [Bacteroidales bacterium]|nr:hypothetical protein [Bacteroidales bacterium]MCB8999353.1 hypothetical protein [Bacteroidales bacterium]MCB9013404.1 hypothetical protein [Bacteroidales bacterium]
MKTLSWLCGFWLVLFSFSSDLYSQDVILLRTGDEIKATVNEISNDIIKYRKFENPTGPFYTISKSDVFMIKYENGTREVFENTDATTKPKNQETTANEASGALTFKKPQSVYQKDLLLIPKEIRLKYKDSDGALKYYNKGTQFIKTGKILAGASLAASISVGLLVKNPSPVFGWTAVGFSSASLIGSIWITVNGRHKIRKSVELYNSQNPQ